MMKTEPFDISTSFGIDPALQKVLVNLLSEAVRKSAGL